MQSFSDFLYGAMIAGVVLLLVLSLKIRGEQTSIDAAKFRAAKTREIVKRGETSAEEILRVTTDEE